MPDKTAKQSVEEVGVLPLLDSKNPRTWWYVFSACLLLTFSTRLYKVSHSVIGRDDGRLLKMVVVAYAHPSFDKTRQSLEREEQIMSFHSVI